MRVTVGYGDPARGQARKLLRLHDPSPNIKCLLYNIPTFQMLDTVMKNLKFTVGSGQLGARVSAGRRGP